jgi:hypothetical protein
MPGTTKVKATKKVSLGTNAHPVQLHMWGRAERVSSYIEIELYRFLEQYRADYGYRSVSEVMRHLTILGAESEGFTFVGNGR